jgi:hypothetical protein
MAPERLEGSKQLGPPTDLYSLGVLLWEMGAGRPFYDSGRLTSIFRTCRERTPDEEAESLATFIPDVAPLVRRLLQRDFDERPQLASEVVAELERLVAATPCEGGAAQLLDRIEILEAKEPVGGQPPGICPWDAIIEVAGALRGASRSEGTPRPHDPGLAVCGRRARDRAAAGAEDDVSTADWSTVGHDRAADTADWSMLGDDGSGTTSDWSTLEIDDWNER